MLVVPRGQALRAQADEGARGGVSEQRTVQRLQAEVRALEYELTAAKVWLGVQADQVARVHAFNRRLLVLLWLTTKFETQA